MPIKTKPDSTGDPNFPDLLATSESETESDEDDETDDDNFEDLGGFQVSRGLPRHEEKRHTLRKLMGLLDKPDGINLSPVYQRDFVWNEERQVGLIDSLFQGYYVPGLIFNKRMETTFGSIRKESLICIDGKQRLTSVRRFTEGLIPCHDRHGDKWWFRESAGKTVRRRKYLPQAAKDEFWDKMLLCFEYVGMSDDQEHDLFERVQRGNPLSSAEKAQAQKGDWQDLARSFQKDFNGVASLSETRRGAGHDKFISSFAQILEGQKNDAQETSFRGTKQWVQKYFVTEASQHSCTQDLVTRIKRTFDRFEELARRNKHAFENDGLHQKATIAPVEFIAIAFILDRYGGQKDNGDLEKAIRAMRRVFRSVHNDNVRRKPMVWKTLMAAAQASLGDNRGTKRPTPEDTEDAKRHRRIRQRYGLED